MLVMKENERLYPSTWEYNASLILTELAKIVINNGGRVKPLHSAVISNRTLAHTIIDKKAHLERVEKNITENKLSGDQVEKFGFYIANLKEEIGKLESINNDPVKVTHTSYIAFVLDGLYYYYQVDDNPFFPFYYRKTELKSDGSYSMDACSDDLSKEWLHDCFFSFNCSKADIKEAANLIFNQLVTAPKSVIRIDYVKRRVPNYYNNGYHYEKIYNKERFEKINF